MIRRYKILPSDDGQFYYVQIGGNGEILNTSELYTRREDAERGIVDANPDGNYEILED